MIYYNENNREAAAWLRVLMLTDAIPWGDVDERSIVDVKPSDLRGYVQCHFFAGIGGWAEALRLAAWPLDRPIWTGSCPCQPFSSAGKQKGKTDERHLWPYFFRLIKKCRPASVVGEQVASKLGRAWLAGVQADLETLDFAFGAADLCAAGVSAPHIRQRIWWLADACGQGQSGQPVDGEMARIGRVGAGGMADADSRQRDRVASGEGCQPNRQTTRREQGNRIAKRSGATGGMADAGPPGRRALQRTGGEDGRPSIEPDGHRDTLGLGDTNIAGSQGRLDRSGEGRRADQRLVGAAGQSGFWSDYGIVHCTDGKARRTGPGVFPLAHGVPGRVGRLRGYGNAIVPEIAATFIKAYMSL